MAIGANEFALVYLLEHAPSIVATGQISKVAALQASREMVPLHHLRSKYLPAVRAGPSGLQAATPGKECEVALSFLFDSPRLDPLVVFSVVRPPARLAPGLAAFATAMKLCVRFLLAASATPFHRYEATV
jgi:hypothetical protein